MKKALIGLLVLGSISSYAGDCSKKIKRLAKKSDTAHKVLELFEAAKIKDSAIVSGLSDYLLEGLEKGIEWQESKGYDTKELESKISILSNTALISEVIKVIDKEGCKKKDVKVAIAVYGDDYYQSFTQEIMNRLME